MTIDVDTTEGRLILLSAGGLLFFFGLEDLLAGGESWLRTVLTVAQVVAGAAFLLAVTISVIRHPRGRKPSERRVEA
ncbi:hypothetical protein [Cellulomonas xiejunii]|uniref:Uncharacterized protein n=1 Tax=Cellulomonas xiejunii TaxID=2968083 RepID=A0ABY5KNN5_9CELL|nr:hypothetical protein [Cellulomonas xiejunii]MCC2314998.1 hypothetical protein [Cellulomonas xiejunii]MCC2321535.1 hypothetical protein [Cellulomonas xiejunii]MCC2323313.1 hypothetical protein [Cellulomonas xiejunii]UUI72107.1 hypothetical protein NP048_01135 [Cellulomonas xiejunii]